MRINAFMNQALPMVFRRLFRLIAMLCLCPILCEAHSKFLHEAITQSAVLSSSGFPQFLNDTVGDTNVLLFFNPLDFPAAKLSPISWTTNGALHEDDGPNLFNPGQGPRYVNHFYTLASTRVPSQ